MASHHEIITNPGEPDEAHDHVVSLGLLATVFFILLGLTWLTYAVTKYDFGYNVNLIVALVIAVVKGALVCLFFMHLWWDSKFNALALISSLGFVALFIVIACLDTGQYHKELDPPAGYDVQVVSAPK